MEFDEIVVKETPGLCRCCLSEGCYKDLSTEYTWMEEQEIYADMLLECFDISISQHMEGPNGPNRLICEVCITRLRDACNFKKQVLDSEKKFVDMVGRGEFKAKVIAYEPMKSEMSVLQPVVETEVEYLEDDMDYDDENKDDPEPTVSEDITVTALPVKGKRGRPKKTIVKPEKKKPRAEEKPKTKIAKDVPCNRPAEKCSANKLRRSNLQILLNNTTIIPFKWRGKYMCFYCGEDINEYDELRQHTNNHGACSDDNRALRLVKAADAEVKIDVSAITCNLCCDKLPNFDDTVDHLMRKHNLPYDKDVKLSIAPYRLSDLNCLLCDQKFNYLSKLISHVNMDHPNDCLVCVECKQKFNKKRDLDAHVRTKHRNLFTCTKCFLSFSTNSELLSHKSSSHPFLCNICFKPFLSIKKRLQHIKTTHLDVLLKCGFCSKSSNTKAFWEHALKCNVDCKDSNDVIVPDDGKKPSVKQIRNNIACILNMSTVVPFKYYMCRFRCFYCPKDFDECDDLKQHTIIEHPLCDTKLKSMKLRNRHEGGIKIDISLLSCKICYESLQDLNTLIDHLICEHKINYDKSVTVNLLPYKLSKDNFPCPFCGEIYRYFRSLLNHVGKTHSDNKNICVHCGLPFRNLPNLRAHIARHHKVANFKCDFCDLHFTSNNYLQTHLGRVHGSKVADCSECDEKFTSLYEMQRHRVDVHSTGHECTYCHKLFTRNSFMVNHIRRTHLKERNVECAVCNERFFDAQRLKVHMVKHYDEGPHEISTCVRRRKNLETLFNNTTIMPFKWRGKYQCFYCGISFAEYPEFLRHTKSHGLCSTSDNSLKLIKGNHVELKIDISEILCEVCYEPFTNLNEIIDHLIGKHDLEYDKTVDIPFQEYRLADGRCHLCGQQFPYFANLITHVNVAHPKNIFICGNCGLNYNKERDLAYHLRNYHKHGGYRCEECSEVFPNSFRLTGHKNKFHFRRCKLCDARFPSYTLLQKHKERDHPDDGSQNLCHYCSKQCKSAPSLTQHLRKCKMKTVSKPAFPEETIQPKKKRDIIQVRRNIQCILNMSTAIPFRFFSRYSCFHCSKHFVEFDDLKSHVVSEHPVCDLKDKSLMKCKGERITVKIDISELSCKVCYERFDNLDDLIDHLIAKHDAPYDKSIKECFDAFKIIKDNIPCNICSNVFRYFSSLLRHINSEHSNNNKICDYCGRSFKNVCNLSMHITIAHTGACECDVCGAKYRNQWCLGRHKAKSHNAKVIQCPECDERFQSHYHKQKHMIKAHEIGHKCTYCGKMFTRNSFMKDHIRRTHLKEKNVPCSVCNEKFFDNYLLKLHMVKHKGERNFSCEFCGKAFLRRSNLNSHKELHKKYGNV